MEFRWQDLAEAEYYQFRLFNQANRDSPLFESTVSGGTGQTLDWAAYGDGDYYWTVQAFADENNLKSRRNGLVSEAAFSVTVNAPPPAPPVARPRPVQPAPVVLLPAAENRQPASGYLIGPAQLRESVSLNFSWDPVEGAAAYIFSVLSARRELINTVTLNQTSYTIENLAVLDVGDFYWQLEAVNFNADGSVKQHGIIIQNRFTIDIPLPGDPGRHNTGTLYGR
jgi:hypothetical protein